MTMEQFADVSEEVTEERSSVREEEERSANEVVEPRTTDGCRGWM